MAQVTARHRAAVSELSAALVTGAVCTATVLASTRLGVYLLVEHPGAPDTVLPVLTADALALPTAVRLAHRGTVPLPIEVGDPVRVGESRIVAPGLDIDVVRTVRPARARRHPALATAIHLSHDSVRELLGRGPGLTPEGDDELAGMLLVAYATCAPVPDLEPELHRTTALSASLLRAAARGYAVPAVVAYVDAVLARDQQTQDRLRPQIEAIGHTSGMALLRGIHAAHPDHPHDERTVA